MDETKERILSAALELFSSRGYAATSTRALAAAAGVNEVTLFRSFGSKKNIYVETFLHYAVSTEKAFAAAKVEGRPERDLPAIARAVAELIRNNSKLVCMSDKEMGSFPEIDAILRGQPGGLVTLVSEYLAGIDTSIASGISPESYAHTFITAVFGGVIFLVRHGDGEKMVEYAERVAAMFVAGLASGEGSAR